MHKFIAWLAHAMAIIGGLALTALILLTCVSILGRSGNTLAHSDWLSSSFPGLTQWLIEHGVGPVNGDFELVEAGIAFAIFAFLPICQLRGGHATVDIFTTHLPKRANQFLVTFLGSADGPGAHPDQLAPVHRHAGQNALSGNHLPAAVPGLVGLWRHSFIASLVAAQPVIARRCGHGAVARQPDTLSA
ncbi:MAG: TRAP transporter small permease subunit [Thiolinea sp.]